MKDYTKEFKIKDSDNPTATEIDNELDHYNNLKTRVAEIIEERAPHILLHPNGCCQAGTDMEIAVLLAIAISELENNLQRKMFFKYTLDKLFHDRMGS